MATIYWKGTATAVAQVATTTFATYDTSTTRIVTIGGVAVSAADSGGTLTAALTAFAVVLNASTHPYFAAITWTSNATQIIGTADTAGVPFTFAGSVSGGTGTLADAYTVTTASAGPNDWSTATNWSGGAVPVNSDIVILKDSEISICWGFAQSAVTLDELRIEKSYTGRIGLNRTVFAQSSDGSTTTTASALEYRSTYLAISYTLLKIGENNSPGNPTGSSRIMLDSGSNAATVEIHGSNVSSEEGRPAIRLKANSSSTDIFVRSAPGGVGIAIDTPGETSTIRKISVSDTGSTTRVFVGPGTTVTTWEQQGGDNILSQEVAGLTTVTVNGGVLVIEGDASGTITTMNANGGTVYPNCMGTIGTLVLNGGTVDMLGSRRARTITTFTPTRGTYRADGNIVTITNKIAQPATQFNLEFATA